ncbi:MAG: tetratricopeptide (TPR) repeat protein [Oleiphilaceae bacterium]|jgi:tetratricopeptide (TPR) repeat protein
MALTFRIAGVKYSLISRKGSLVNGPTANSLMSEGTKYLSAQNFTAAKTCFLKVIEAYANESEAYFLLSWIAHNENQAHVACDYLKKANALQPFNKKYLSGLANVYSQLGEFHKAIELYQGYLRMDGSPAEVYYNYASTLIKVKELGLAFEAFQKAISLDPTQLPYYMALGQLLYHVHKNRDAQKVYLSALSRGLKSEGLYQNIAKLHADFGELEEAKGILNQASIAYPDNLAFIYRLSMLESDVLTTTLFDSLNTHTDESLSLDNQFYRYWLLSKFSDKENAASEEMQFLAKAHSIFKELNAFAFDKEFYLESLPKFDLPRIPNIEALQDKASKALEPIFIVGIPRCGSTLLENIICSGPKPVLKGEETGAIFHAVTQSLQKNTPESHAQDLWLNIREQAKALYQSSNLLQENTRFTDKSLENIFLVDLILALYPKAKIIYCVRKPLASVVSIMKNNMVTLPWAHDLNDILEYVDNSLKTIAKWNEIYPESILTVQYENLVTEPEVESKKLMSFCDLEWHESCLNFHENKYMMSKTASHIQIRDKINQNALTTYQKYKPFFEQYSSKYPWLSEA